MLEADDLTKLFTGISMPMTKVVADMEMYGFKWDLNVAEKLLLLYKKKATEMEFEIKMEMGDEKINLRSGDQLAKKLFTSIEDGGMGVSTKGVDRTKSGKRYCTDKDTLEKLAPKYPICQKLVSYRHSVDMLSNT